MAELLDGLSFAEQSRMNAAGIPERSVVRLENVVCDRYSAAGEKVVPVSGWLQYPSFDERQHHQAHGVTAGLPAFERGSRLLFHGDSITDMKWGRDQADRNHYLGHSYVFLIAARLGVDMPDAQLDFYNRGVSGNTVADLRDRWQRDAVGMNPDLLSILVGTNDVGFGVKTND